MLGTRAALFLISSGLLAASLDLSHAVIVVRPGALPEAEKTAATVLMEELQTRTGVRLATVTSFPKDKPAIAITSQPAVSAWHRPVPAGERRAEGYRLYMESSQPPVVWLLGADPRGTLYAAGRLLRKLDWAPGVISLAEPVDITTAPQYPIRGHQLGYRTQANSWDAWTVAQFEQYIRELAFFGVNSIENIPFHDDRKTPVMKVPRREMNRAMSEICKRYGLDYWVWTPADFDLNDSRLRERELARYEELFKDSPEMTGVFFPGGDPGKNPPELVLPFLEDVAKRLTPLHPKAKVWLSLQWFTPAQVDTVYQYLDRKSPAWFAGLIAGPSGPPIAATRMRLPKQYQLRLYPDLTHNKLSQYQVPQWDQAYALTLGREAINPRPAEYAAIHNRTAPYSTGFISYSDGVHDDVNKTIWSALSWDSSLAVRDILIDYARVYFQPGLAEQAADGILALEKNWRGPLADNGAVEATLGMWRQLESRAPGLAGNWRWQMCLLRANYDAYIRHRLIHETKLEQEANSILAHAATSEAAMTAAGAVLNSPPVSPDLRQRIEQLCEQLFHSIGLQSSVEKYYASGAERGAVLDFVDYPMNNHWWLEDQFQKIRALSSEPEKLSRLRAIAAWENPGPGSFYDNVGNIAKSPHVERSDAEAHEPTFWWWKEGKSRERLTSQVTTWPKRMVYEALDTHANYIVRTVGFGQALLRINGERVEGAQAGEFREFPVPASCVNSGRLELTFDRPLNEEHVNWRQQSRLAEVWLLKR